MGTQHQFASGEREAVVECQYIQLASWGGLELTNVVTIQLLCTLHFCLFAPHLRTGTVTLAWGYMVKVMHPMRYSFLLTHAL